MSDNRLVACIALIIGIVVSVNAAFNYMSHVDQISCKKVAIEQHLPIDTIEKQCK